MELTLPNGDKYIGIFKEGQMDGHGTEDLKDVGQVCRRMDRWA